MMNETLRERVSKWCPFDYMGDPMDWADALLTDIGLDDHTPWYCSCGWTGFDHQGHMDSTGHAVRNFAFTATPSSANQCICRHDSPDVRGHDADCPQGEKVNVLNRDDEQPAYPSTDNRLGDNDA